MRLKQEKLKANRSRIIESGLTLMKLHGFHGTSIKDITDHANIPKGSFFNYFDSKNEFTKVLIDAYANEAREKAITILSDKESTPYNRIINYFQSHIDHISKELKYKEGCFINTMCQELSDVNEDVSSLLLEKIQMLRIPLISCIEEGQDGGSITNSFTAEELAIFIDNAFRGATVTVKTERNNKPYEIFNKIISNLLQPS